MSRWVVHAHSEFTARHALTSYLGEPEASHEHRWRAAIRVGVEALNDEGYAIDFHLVQRALAEETAPLAGSDLNRHPRIGAHSPSAERVAEFLAEGLGERLAGSGGRLLSVSVWEGPDNRVDLVLEGAPPVD